MLGRASRAVDGGNGSLDRQIGCPVKYRPRLVLVASRAQRQFEVVLQPEEEGGFSVFVPALPGCASQGETREEALAMIKEAIEGYLESLKAHGDPIPAPVEVERVTVGM